MNDFPYLPHTQKDIEEMFSFLGIKDIDELYRDIPALFKGEIWHN